MILNNAIIVLENEVIKNGHIIIKDKKIEEIGRNPYYGNQESIDLKGQMILPGFIDSHVHGGYGVDFEKGDVNRFDTFAKNVVQEGVVGYLQATITNKITDNIKYFEEFNQFKIKNTTNPVQAKCYGIYMEGPFIDPHRKGAHEEGLLIKPTSEILSDLIKASNNNLKVVLVAGNNENDNLFIDELIKNNIIPTIGHSQISHSDFMNKYNKKYLRMTHLFNAMSPITHQNPGLALTGLVNDDLLVELIADGVHTDNEILKLVYKTKDINKLCLITDAMNAKGLEDGNYQLGNLNVVKKGIRISLVENGSLAASGATYDHVVRNFAQATNISLIDMIKTTSINVAKQLKIFDQTGSIEVDKLANLVILNKNFEVQKTIIEGQIVFSK